MHRNKRTDGRYTDCFTLSTKLITRSLKSSNGSYNSEISWLHFSNCAQTNTQTFTSSLPNLPQSHSQNPEFCPSRVWVGVGQRLFEFFF